MAQKLGMSMIVKAWKIVGVIFIVIIALQTINLVSAIGVTEYITSGTEYGGHYGIAYDYGKSEMFITNVDFNSVTVISDSSHVGSC